MRERGGKCEAVSVGEDVGECRSDGDSEACPPGLEGANIPPAEQPSGTYTYVCVCMYGSRKKTKVKFTDTHTHTHKHTHL